MKYPLIATKIDSRVASLGDALREVRKLLAPGGRLLLHEMCSGKACFQLHEP